jgi:hypothetical protein
MALRRPSPSGDFGSCNRHRLALPARDVRRQRNGGVPAKAGRIPEPEPVNRSIAKGKRPLHGPDQEASKRSRNHRERGPRAAPLHPPRRGCVRSSRASRPAHPRHQRSPEIAPAADIRLTNRLCACGMLRWKKLVRDGRLMSNQLLSRHVNTVSSPGACNQAPSQSAAPAAQKSRSL